MEVLYQPKQSANHFSTGNAFIPYRAIEVKGGPTYGVNKIRCAFSLTMAG